MDESSGVSNQIQHSREKVADTEEIREYTV